MITYITNMHPIIASISYITNRNHKHYTENCQIYDKVQNEIPVEHW